MAEEVKSGFRVPLDRQVQLLRQRIFKLEKMLGVADGQLEMCINGNLEVLGNMTVHCGNVGDDEQQAM
jgi:hypothetical protein